MNQAENSAPARDLARFGARRVPCKRTANWTRTSVWWKLDGTDAGPRLRWQGRCRGGYKPAFANRSAHKLAHRNSGGTATRRQRRILWGRGWRKNAGFCEGGEIRQKCQVLLGWDSCFPKNIRFYQVARTKAVRRRSKTAQKTCCLYRWLHRRPAKNGDLWGCGLQTSLVSNTNNSAPAWAKLARSAAAAWLCGEPRDCWRDSIEPKLSKAIRW